MNHTELDQYLEIIKACLIESGAKINKWGEKFMLEVLLLYMIIPDRINFLQLGRYGTRLAIGFDPSYISKSGIGFMYLAERRREIINLNFETNEK